MGKGKNTITDVSETEEYDNGDHPLNVSDWRSQPLTQEEKAWTRAIIVDLTTRGRFRKKGHGSFKTNVMLIIAELKNRNKFWA